MLTHNWRQHGMAGEFFNKQFYNNTIKFHQAREKYSLVDKATVNWLQSLSGKDDINENTLMINMNSFENCEARSFCNVANVNFILEARRPALGPQTSPLPARMNDAKLLIVAPYQAQRSLYMHELQKRASWDVNNKGNCVPFDKSRVEIRTQRSPSSASSSTTERSSSTSGSGAMNGAQRSSVLSSSEELINLLADPQFTKTTSKGLEADVMIISPYEAQRNLYEHELQRRASLELNSKGDWVSFDKSRIKVRTHQGAQGHEASVVIVDLTRSDAPGMTGHPQVVNVSSSRSICAMLVLINSRMLERVESKNSPFVRNLVQWVQLHKGLGMFIEIDFQRAKELKIVCRKCYAVGHKGTDCPFNKGKVIFCLLCGGKHHPRDCYRGKKDLAVKSVEKTEQI